MREGEGALTAARGKRGAFRPCVSIRSFSLAHGRIRNTTGRITHVPAQIPKLVVKNSLMTDCFAQQRLQTQQSSGYDCWEGVEINRMDRRFNESEVTDPETWQTLNLLPEGEALAVGPLQRILLLPDSIIAFICLSNAILLHSLATFQKQQARREKYSDDTRLSVAQQAQGPEPTSGLFL